MDGTLSAAAQARSLLGRTFTGHDVTVRITEVEAYAGPDDPASHAATRTSRSEIMYGAPGRLYVYRSYGLHHCANVVTGPDGVPGAVLLRGGEVVAGHDVARTRRGVADDARLARGPGNLAAALGLTLADNGADLDDGSSAVRLGEHADPGGASERVVECGPRVGVSRAADVRWRFWLVGQTGVSTYRRSPRAPAPEPSRPG